MTYRKKIAVFMASFFVFMLVFSSFAVIGRAEGTDNTNETVNNCQQVETKKSGFDWNALKEKQEAAKAALKQKVQEEAQKKAQEYKERIEKAKKAVEEIRVRKDQEQKQPEESPATPEQKTETRKDKIKKYLEERYKKYAEKKSGSEEAEKGTEEKTEDKKESQKLPAFECDNLFTNQAWSIEVTGGKQGKKVYSPDQMIYNGKAYTVCYDVITPDGVRHPFVGSCDGAQVEYNGKKYQLVDNGTSTFVATDVCTQFFTGKNYLISLSYKPVKESTGSLTDKFSEFFGAFNEQPLDVVGWKIAPKTIGVSWSGFDKAPCWFYENGEVRHPAATATGLVAGDSAKISTITISKYVADNDIAKIIDMIAQHFDVSLFVPYYIQATNYKDGGYYEVPVKVSNKNYQLDTAGLMSNMVWFNFTQKKTTPDPVKPINPTHDSYSGGSGYGNVNTGIVGGETLYGTILLSVLLAGSALALILKRREEN